MIKAIVFDCFGVLVTGALEVKNQELLTYIAEIRKTHKTGLLSNISIDGLYARFDPGELDRYFDTVVVSGEIGYAKPEAEAYETVADRLGIRLDECVFIDDREDYCLGAEAVGMQAILYVSFSQVKSALDTLLV